MNTGTLTCLMMSGMFLVFASLFALLKEKGAMLISGFNTLPKAEREKYNQGKMSKDMRNTLFVWAILFIVGTVFCYFISSYFAIIAFIIWGVLFCKEVSFDVKKAFTKYKL